MSDGWRDPARAERALRAAVERVTGRPVDDLAVVHGGDTSAAYAVRLSGGGRVFAKYHPAPAPFAFTTEATGLRWLRDGLPGAPLGDALGVPEVLAASDGDDEAPPHLVLEWVNASGRRGGPSAERAFGAALAALHGAGAPAFGRGDRRPTGSRGLPNEPVATWAEHYAANRLLPLARIARDEAALPPAAIDVLERLAGRLAELDDGSPPARLHGDLWAGNRLVDDGGRSWLVDPAAHGGHRELDLALMALFGGFGTACWEGYAEVHPLADGWRERVPLHQLATLVVHAIKFGGGYVAATARALDAASRL